MSAPARTPFVNRLLGVTVPAMALDFLRTMRRMEEATMDPRARWDLLRQRLEHLSKQGERPADMKE